MNIKYKVAAASLLAVFVFPLVSSAQTVDQLQAEIQSLLAQVQALQQQLAMTQGGSGAWCHTFNTNLRIGASSSEVTQLQTALQKDGESVDVSGSFDDQTASAVTGFQEKYASDILAPNGLQHGTGYAGTATRKKLNALFGCGNTNPVPTPIPYPIPTPVPTPQPVSGSSPSLTISTDPTIITQSGTVTPGGKGYVLLAADLTAGASDVRISSMGFGCGGDICTQVTNMKMVTVESNPQTWTELESLAPGLFNPNLLIPAGTTKKIEFIGDVSLSAPVGHQMWWTLSSTQVSLVNADNVQGYSNGNTLTVTASPNQTATPSYTVSLASDSPSGQIALGTSNAAVLKFTLQNNASEPLKVNGIAININSSLGNASQFGSFTLSDSNGTQIGGPTTASNVGGPILLQFAFSPQYIVPRGASVTLTVKGNVSPLQISPNIVNSTAQFTLNSTGIVALGATSNVIATQSGAANGATLTIVGQPAQTVTPSFTVSLTQDSPSGQIAVGASNIPVFKFSLQNNAAESLKVNGITVNGNSSLANASQFSSFSLFDSNGVQIGGPIIPSSINGVVSLPFNFVSQYVIPQGSSVTFTVKGNVNSMQISPNIVNSTVQFSLGNNGIVALGATSNIAATQNGTATGVTLTITGASPQTVQVSQVQGLTAIASGSSVNLSWQAASATNGVSAYYVYRSTSPNFTPSFSNTVTAVAGSLSYTDSNLVGGNYYYAVAAQDSKGTVGSASAQVVVGVTVAPTFAIAQDASNPTTTSLFTGANPVTLMAFDISNSSGEDIKVMSIKMNEAVFSASTHTQFTGLILSDIASGVQVGQLPALQSVGSGVYASTFNFANPLVIPAHSQRAYRFSGAVLSYSVDPSIAGTSAQFSIPINGITAIGASSNIAASYNGGSLTGNQFGIAQGQ